MKPILNTSKFKIEIKIELKLLRQIATPELKLRYETGLLNTSLYDGRLHEVAHAVVVGAAGHDARVGPRLGVVDVALDAVEALAVDDCAHEGVELERRAHL